MTAETQHRARQALAFLAQTLRPDWDPPGIHAAIEALHRDRQALGVIAKATISAALTPTTKTPGGIAARIRDGFDGSNAEPATPTQPRFADFRCRKCGFQATEPGHECGQRSGPTDEWRQARAALKVGATKEMP